MTNTLPFEYISHLQRDLLKKDKKFKTQQHPHSLNMFFTWSHKEFL
jgi:hypothetical protein